MRTSIAAAVIVAMLPVAVRAAEWHEKLKVKGDFRHRHELVRQEDSEDQNRWRIRARLSVEAEISECWSAAVGLASGSDDPVSTNQTLTDGFSTKQFGLDLAYFDLHPAAIEGLSIVGGKMKLPFETPDKTELLWDGDLNPEGVALRLSRGIGGKAKMYLNGAGFYITDRDPDNESYFGGVQAGLNIKASDGVNLSIGAGYYDFEGAEGMPFFYKTNKSYGNSGSGSYAVDYNEVEALGAVDVTFSDKTALKLYGNYVNNVAADSLNTGWLFGAAVKHGKDKGAVKVYANYRRLEADAVVGAFTDSDFAGGGTNGKGLEMGAAYGLAKNVSFDLTYFANTKGIKDTDEEAGYQRLQADVQLKF